MEQVNLRDPASLPCRIFVGRLNQSITEELLNIKFSLYGKIVGHKRINSGEAKVKLKKSSASQNFLHF